MIPPVPQDGTGGAPNDADLVVAFDAYDVVAFARDPGPDSVVDRQAMIEDFTGTREHGTGAERAELRAEVAGGGPGLSG